MPIYEYKCLECDSHFEKMQKISDAPPTVCENCGGKLEKQWSRSGFQFKGSGWYVTDYSNKGKPEPTKSETTAVSKSEPASPAAESSEKSSTSESTAQPETASKTTKGESSTSKKE